MASVRPLPQPIGLIKIDDDRLPEAGGREYVLPIYGAEEVQLDRTSNWNTQVLGPTAQGMIQWSGTQLVMYNFNFTLTAGHTVDDHAALYRKMKAAAAMVSHVMKDGQAQPPPRCLLIVGRFINSYGVVMDMRLNGKAPWAMGDRDAFGDQDSIPTQVCFSGNFLLAPGYDKGIVSVQDQTKSLSAQSTLSKFYKFT